MVVPAAKGITPEWSVALVMCIVRPPVIPGLNVDESSDSDSISVDAETIMMLENIKKKLGDAQSYCRTHFKSNVSVGVFR